MWNKSKFGKFDLRELFDAGDNFIWTKNQGTSLHLSHFGHSISGNVYILINERPSCFPETYGNCLANYRDQYAAP